MLNTDTVFNQILDSDPYGITEKFLTLQVSSALGGRPIGNDELAESLNRLEARRFIVATRNDNNDSLWSLTPAGRTEAQRRFR